MRSVRSLSAIVFLGAAALIAITAYFEIRKTCCEQLSDQEIRALERAGGRGDVKAMKRLYVFFEDAGDPKQADIWLKRAADTGDADTEFQVWGLSVPAQRPAALPYLRRSAEHGSSFAQATLGELYRDGVDVPKSIETAKYWLQKSARAGEPSGVLALCDIAAAERDQEQCRECLLLEHHAVALLKPGTYYVIQLEQQKQRIEGVLKTLGPQ